MIIFIKYWFCKKVVDHIDVLDIGIVIVMKLKLQL